MTIPQIDVIAFLQKKGYEIKAFKITYVAEEEFLLTEPPLTVNTFTATKENSPQNIENLYLKVFEKEIKDVLKVKTEIC